MTSRTWRRAAFIPLLAACMAKTGFAAQDAATMADAGSATGRDPEAVAALASMASALRALDSFSVRSVSSVDVVLETGQKIQLDQRITYRARRPDGLYVELESDRRHRQIYFDGKDLTVYSPRLNYYASASTRAHSLDELVTNAGRDYSIVLPLADLFYWGTPDLPVDALTSAVYIGPATVGATKTDQYAFRQPGVDWQVWIAGDSRLPQKIVITNVDDPALPEFRAQLDWDVHTPVPESTFRFKAPKDAALIVLKLPADSGNTN